MEKVSIIIPIYNGEKYLKDTIDSCINQKYDNIEIILVNDASTDGSEDIVKQFLHIEKITYLVNESNMGAMKSCNRGIAAATGTKILVLGQDDILPQEHIQRVMKCFKDGDSFVVSNPQRIDETGKRGELIYEEEIFNSLAKDIKFQLAKNNIIPSTGLIMDKDKLLKCGGYDETYRNYGEWSLWIHMLTQGDMGTCSDSHPYYRTHSNNLTSTFSSANNQKKNLEIQRFWLNCQRLAIKELEIKGLRKIYLQVRYLCKKLIYHKNCI